MYYYFGWSSSGCEIQKKFKGKKDLNIDDSGEGLSFSRGESECGGMSKSKRGFTSQRYNAILFEKPGYFKRNCLERKDSDDHY